MGRALLQLLAWGLAATGAGGAWAGSTVYSSGSGIAIVSGSGIAIGDVVVAKGPMKTEERKPAAYSGLVIEAPVDMTYAVGSPASLKVTAPANILPLVTTDVKAGQLVIGLKKSVSMERRIRVEAVGPSPESVAMTGTGDLKATGLAGRKLEMEISGSGSMTMAGQVDKVAVEVSGSGDIDAAALRSRDLTVDVSGSGTVAAHASASAKIDLSGSGDITVAGRPAKREVDRSGAGSVTFR